MQGWFLYFEKRPVGWRADNRAAVIASSLGGGNTKPEDMFSSLRIISRANSAKSTVATKFIDRFKHKFTNKDVKLDD